MSARIRVRTVLLSTMVVAMLAGPAPAASAITLGQGQLFGLLGSNDGATDSSTSAPDSTGLTGFMGSTQSGQELLAGLD